MKNRFHTPWINGVIGSLVLVFLLAAVTGAQCYIQLHWAAPWREVLLLASLPLEYWGLAQWSAWMNREVDAPAMVEMYKLPVAPVVLASSGIPSEEAVSEAARAAHELHKPVVLVSLVAQLDEPPAWIEAVWRRLADQGVRVAAQTVLTQESKRSVNDIVGAMGASYVVVNNE